MKARLKISSSCLDCARTEGSPRARDAACRESLARKAETEEEPVRGWETSTQNRKIITHWLVWQEDIASRTINFRTMKFIHSYKLIKLTSREDIKTLIQELAEDHKAEEG